MKSFNVAILGCGTVGGGVAKILLEMKEELSERASQQIQLIKIVEPNASAASKQYGIPTRLFCGGGADITLAEAGKYIREILESDDIHLVVETIGGISDFVHSLCVDLCKSGKHLVTANKALLAERGKEIYEMAEKSRVKIGFEAAVCGAIPIVKAIKECFSGDSVESISGIMNGTSNYILSQMQDHNLAFQDALKMAQEKGYAEADPTLDINGYDAGHKLVILTKLAFGMNLTMEQLSVKGINKIGKEDIDFAKEIDSKIKLICYVKKTGDKLYATVCPMMVKNDNFLSGVNGATNAVRLVNKYGGRHILVGAGAGSSETASSIAADIVFIARYSEVQISEYPEANYRFVDAKHFQLPYMVVFTTEDVPGTTGLIATCIGNQDINIDTVSHNKHSIHKAVFSVVTMPCTLKQLEEAVKEIRKKRPDVLLNEPEIIPILY